MATNTEVRNALVAVLDPALGNVNVYRLPPDTIQAPAVILGGMEWQDHDTDGDRVLTMQMFVAVSRKNTSQIDVLDDLCDPSGRLISTIDADPSLGDVVESAAVKSVGNYRDLTIAETDYYAATITLEVFC